MCENLTLADIESAFVSGLKMKLEAFGKPNVKVLHNFSYLKKGLTSGEVVYYHVSSPQKIGYADRKFKNEQHVEYQHYQARIELKATANEDEAPELAMLVIDIINSLPFIERMRKSGIGLQKASDVITLPTQDEKDNFILECNVSLPITFNRSITAQQAAIDAQTLTTLHT